MDGAEGMNIGLGEGNGVAAARRRRRTNKPANFSAYSSGVRHEVERRCWRLPGPRVAQCQKDDVDGGWWANYAG